MGRAMMTTLTVLVLATVAQAQTPGNVREHGTFPSPYAGEVGVTGDLPNVPVVIGPVGVDIEYVWEIASGGEPEYEIRLAYAFECTIKGQLMEQDAGYTPVQTLNEWQTSATMSLDNWAIVIFQAVQDPGAVIGTCKYWIFVEYRTPGGEWSVLDYDEIDWDVRVYEESSV